MSIIKRIASLKELGVFRNFAAPADLPDFQRHNLIYGFNGSGKTILSRVFASLGEGAVRPELPEGGTFEVELTGETVIKSTGSLDALKGRVLVFNVDFIEENLRWKEGTANPVFYLGKAQAELANKLEKTDAAMTTLTLRREEVAREYAQKERAFTDHKRDAARLIAEQLSLGRRYDASNLTADHAKGSYDEKLKLSEAERQQMRTIITQDAPLAKRDPLDTEPFGLAGQIREVRKILDTTLGTMALEDLREHETMLKWVKEGVDYHQEHDLSSCLFCGNELTEERMLALGYRPPEEAYLLLTQHGEFWGLPLLDEETGVRSAAALYDANSGKIIRSAEAHQLIKSTDSNLANLEWVSDSDARVASSREPLAEELQNIVQVPVAERWADYRPARPADFVGREGLQREIFLFFDRVRNDETKTRLMAIKAPSGLGKSSLVLKIADRAQTGRNARRYFVFPVDSRAAASTRFGEFAFVTMVREAIKQKFVAAPMRVAFGGSNNPFSTLSMQQVVEQLRKNNRVLCLFFDQFEELLYREDLEKCFNEIRNLCHAVDAAQENIIIAFSWKTGGSLPEGHAAYHLWHSLADRRLDFDIPLFTGQEVTSALRKFEKELKEPLVPQLRRMLYDNCQGLPWLLKKLSIHVLELLQTGVDQIDATLQSLHIHRVFERDIDQLSPGDHACLKEIAEKSPAEFFETRNIYGDEVLNRLLDKRLVILSGQKLSIYWDIFRDFLITDRTPEIPVSYIPKSGVGRYVTAIICLAERHEVDIDRFLELMEISERSAYFLFSDLVTIGHAEVDKQAGVIRSLTANINAAEKKLLEFLNSHTVFKQILDENGHHTIFNLKYFHDVVVDRCPMHGLRKTTIYGYAQGLRRFFESLGLICRVKDGYRIVGPSETRDIAIRDISKSFSNRNNIFMGESPPQKTIVALSNLLADPINRTDAERVYGRNPIQTLVKLGLFDAHGDLCFARDIQGADARQIVLAAAEADEVSKYVAALMEESSKISSREVGDRIADKYDSEWSDSSKQRIGGALYQWVWWIRRQHQRKDIMDAAAIVEAVRSMPSDSKEEIPISFLYADDELAGNRGRPVKLGPEVFKAIEELRHVHGMNSTLLAQRFGVSRATIQRGLRRRKKLPESS